MNEARVLAEDMVRHPCCKGQQVPSSDEDGSVLTTKNPFRKGDLSYSKVLRRETRRSHWSVAANRDPQLARLGCQCVASSTPLLIRISAVLH